MKTRIFKIILPVLWLFGMVFTFSACDEKNLDLEPVAETEASFFKDDYQFQRAIIGTYAKFTDIFWFNNNDPRHYVWLLPGDDLTTRGSYAFESFNGIIQSEGGLNDLWTAYYRIISRANVILEKIEESPGDPSVNITEATTEWIKGEALFLRSIIYYKLWNFWGTAPLVNKRIKDLASSKTPNSAGTELLDQAIADMTLAVTLLPDEWETIYTGRVTKEAAYGLMGKCLVFRACHKKKTDAAGATADYNAAIEAFNHITTRSLTANFADNFSYATENNSESLFEWQAGLQEGFENIWLNNDFGQNMSMHSYWGFFNCEWSFWAGTPWFPTQKLINAFEAGDPRIEESLVATADERYDGYQWVKYTKNIGPQGLTNSANNPRILRYADILLLKAEAILKSGGSKSAAVDLINQIRTRARGAGTIPADLDNTETDEATIMQWIMDERFLELSGEDDHRWFDLKRWHYAGYIDLATWGSDNNGFSSVRTDFDFPNWINDTEGKLWFPIPSIETDQNELIVQNPG